MFEWDLLFGRGVEGGRVGAEPIGLVLMVKWRGQLKDCFDEEYNIRKQGEGVMVVCMLSTDRKERV